MAKKRNQNIQNTTQSHVNTFMGGMNRDSDPSFIKKGEWTHARNAVNNTREGELGTLSNEESNALCGIIGSDITVNINVVIVGAIPLFESKWLVYSAIYDTSINNNIITSLHTICYRRNLVKKQV